MLGPRIWGEPAPPAARDQKPRTHATRQPDIEEETTNRDMYVDRRPRLIASQRPGSLLRTHTFSLSWRSGLEEIRRLIREIARGRMFDLLIWGTSALLAKSRLFHTSQWRLSQLSEGFAFKPGFHCFRYFVWLDGQAFLGLRPNRFNACLVFSVVSVGFCSLSQGWF